MILEDFKVTVRRIYDNSLTSFTNKDGFTGNRLTFFCATATGLAMNVQVWDNEKRANATELASVLEVGMRLKVVASRCVNFYDKNGERVYLNIPQVTAAWCEILPEEAQANETAEVAVASVEVDGEDIDFDTVA